MPRFALSVCRKSRLVRCVAVALVLAACSQDHRNREPVESTASGDSSPREPAARPSARDAAARDAAVSSDAAPSDRPGAIGPTLEALMKSYRNWSKRTPEPISISNNIWSLCRLPSLAEQAFVETEHGAGLYLLDWANTEATQGIAAGGKPAFPVGAAIVKEKLTLDGDAAFEVAALGLMIKRGAGFDPAHGDWEFGYWEPSSGLVSGAESAQHCGNCHASSKTDYVFVDMSWRDARVK